MDFTTAIFRCFLYIWVLFFLFSKREDVEAAQCHKSNFHRWRCAPCGTGTRCIFCHWCLCYCHHHKERIKRSITNDTKPITKPPYGENEVQYKIPLIELFQELETLLKNDEISNIEVVELYKATSSALSEDCKLCSNTTEIEELRKQTQSAHEKLTQIMLFENITFPGSLRKKRSPSFISLESDKIFKEAALEDTNEAIKMANKIPDTVMGMIDLNSTIVESLGKCY